MNPKRVLITGGGGFLGASLARLLLLRGCEVRILDLRPPAPDQVGEYIIGDVTDAAAVMSAAQDVDLAFNLASLLPCSRAGELFIKVNVGGTRNLIEAAKACGIRKIVHVSSSVVYGIPVHIPLTEQSPARPIGDYGRSKLKAEKIIQEAAGADLRVTILRPRMIIGPGRLGLLTILFDWVLAGKRVYLIGPGTNRFQMIHLEDLLEAGLLSIDQGDGQIYNLGCDNVPTVGELIQGLIDHAGSKSRLAPLPLWLIRPTLAALDLLRLTPLNIEHYAIADRDYLLDTGKAKKELGWQPRKGQIETMCEAYDWYINNQDKLRVEMPSDMPTEGILKIVKLFS